MKKCFGMLFVAQAVYTVLHACVLIFAVVNVSLICLARKLINSINPVPRFKPLLLGLKQTRIGLIWLEISLEVARFLATFRATSVSAKMD